MDRLRIAEYLGHIVDRSHGHLPRDQPSLPVRYRIGEQNLLNQAHQKLPMRHPIGVGAEARVADPFRMAQALAEAGEKSVICRSNDDVPIGCLERLVGHDRGVAAALWHGDHAGYR